MKPVPSSLVLIAGLSFNTLSFAAAPVTAPVPDLDSQILAVQAEKAARTQVECKLASQLLFLYREQAGLKAVDGAPDLTSRVKLEADGRVLIDLAAAPNADLAQAITAAGGVVIYESERWKSVRAAVPASALLGLAGREDVAFISRGTHPRKHIGSVTSQADTAEKVAAGRLKFGVDGTGIRVGVMSDSATYASNSFVKGDLPSDFTVIRKGDNSDDAGEGTAMSEIVHDLAPGAKIDFASADDGKAAFADAVINLYNAGCKILVDDISYEDEWQFEDDALAKAINQVVAGGALYFSAAGNEGSLKHKNSTVWEGDFLDGGAASSLYPTGRLHNFGSQNYNILTDTDSSGTLQWSDEYTTSTNDYDLYILNSTGKSIVTVSDDVQSSTHLPFESVDDISPGERIVVWKSPSAAARYLRLSCWDSPLQIQTAGQSIGHAATANSICVAATDLEAVTTGSPFTTACVVESYSSDGPHKMFYNPDGTPITPGNFLASGGVSLITPSLTTGDGSVTSVPGFQPYFYGTSAAAPVAASIAAVVWSRKPTLTNVQLRALLESSCLDIETAGRDINSGYGILMADLALEQTRTPQEIWREAKFGVVLPTGTADPLADPDSDAIVNLLEYATGSDPLTHSAPVLTGFTLTGGMLQFNYHRNVSATDAVIVFESSTDLVNWSTVTLASDAITSTIAGVELHTAKLPAAGDKLFYRMRVTAP